MYALSTNNISYSSVLLRYFCRIESFSIQCLNTLFYSILSNKHSHWFQCGVVLDFCSKVPHVRYRRKLWAIVYLVLIFRILLVCLYAILEVLGSLPTQAKRVVHGEQKNNLSLLCLGVTYLFSYLLLTIQAWLSL